MHIYEIAKTWLVEMSWLSRDAVRIYIVLGIQLVSAMAFRRRLASVWPVVIVAAFEAANELSGYLEYRAFQTYPIRFWVYDTVLDTINSLALPIAVMLICRFAPHWATGAAPAPTRADDRPDPD